MTRHNHLTRDVKPLGQCPRCDSTRPLVVSRDLRQLLLTSLALHSQSDTGRCTVCLAEMYPCTTRVTLVQMFR